MIAARRSTPTRCAIGRFYAVNEIESLATNFARKMWQKIMVIDRAAEV